MVLSTPRLLIMRMSPYDYDDASKYLCDAETVKYEPYDPYTYRGCIKEIKRRAKSPAFLGVYLKDTQKLIGNLYFERQPQSSYEIGFIFNKAYHNQGYAFEASRALFSYAFNELNVHRLTAMCNPENTRSLRLLEKLGMRREGYNIKNIYFTKDIYGNPIWQDTYVYAILKDEYNSDT